MKDFPSAALREAVDAMGPAVRDRTIADEASRAFTSMTETPRQARLVVTDAAGVERSVELPVSAVGLISSLVREFARGNAVSLVPTHLELATQEAADLLGVSRPFLVGLLEKGAIPFHKVGVQRRVRLADLLDYKRRSDADRTAALDALARQAQDLGLGYDG